MKKLTNLVNTEKKIISYGGNKMTNKCPYCASPEEDFFGDCKSNFHIRCSSNLKKSYEKCPVYKIEIIQKNNS